MKHNYGYYYKNELWNSEAYDELTKYARDLLQALLTQLKRANVRNRSKRRKEWIIVNNGKISFTMAQFIELKGSSKASYIRARNQLIKNGLIKQTYVGGNYPGDCSKYEILISDDILKNKQRWRRYPNENWESEIIKEPNTRVGVKTRFKKNEK